MTLSDHLPRRIAFVVNDPAFLLSHRREIVLATKQSGAEVHIISPAEPAGAVAAFEAAGCVHHPVPLARGMAGPRGELVTIQALQRRFRLISPDLAHLVTIKPVLYGGIAARLAGVPSLVAAISGLGHVLSGTGLRPRMMRQAVPLLYRRALGHKNKCVIVQNERDAEVLRGWGVALDGQMALVPGSGVLLDAFRPEAVPEDPPLVVMVSRMLVPKGVGDFVAAARLLRTRGHTARFVFVGAPHPTNPESVDGPTLAKWQAEGDVEFWGRREDVPDILARASIKVLPSYYGEGLPKALIEAAAAARPVVTTDLPGCLDAIEPGVTGLTVPPRDPEALARAIAALLEDRARAAEMGRAARARAEALFDVRAVVSRHLAIYADLAEAARRAGPAPQQAARQA